MTPDSQDDPRVGKVLLERYRLLERLQSGGMGVVYRGERLLLGRIVAIKFLHATFAQSRDFLSRFEREAKAMSRLDHPNCVSVIDFGVGDTPFFVMDFVSGTTLKAMIEEGPLAPARAVALIRQVLAGLAHAHERGIIHRDVKPANIMVANATGAGEQARILDFGLAKLIGTDQTLPSLVVGTPSYMSPEQAGGGAVDGRSDVYAATVVLFELLTGRKPFLADDAMKVMLLHVGAAAPTLADALPGGGFSPELEAAIRRGLAKNPAERFQTPAEMAAALAAVPEARGERPRPRTNIGSDPTLAAPPVRRASGAFLGLVLVAALGAGGYFAWNPLGRPGLAAADASPTGPTTLAEADRLAAAGDRDGAIRILHELRRRDPGNGVVSYRLGGLYFDKGWRAEGVAAYREALEHDPRLAGDARLVRALAAALADDAVFDKARALLVSRVGAPGLPALRAARDAARGEPRRRLAQTIAEIEAR